ncbi:MAG: beta-ketoacyl reductase, partial [Paracoccaceae bacterium]
SLDQSPYVAANLGMEESAIRRRGEQLPALAIAWGPIGDTGYLSRHPATRDLIERRFGVLLDSESALEALGGVLERDPERATITIAPTDWSKLGANFPVVAEPLFECLNIGNRPDSAETAIDVGQVVRELGELRARKAVLKVLVLETARIMRTAPSDVDPSRPLLELGFDSLMGMNLVLAAEERLGSHLSAAAISDGLSLDRIAHQVVANAALGGPKEMTADMESRHLTQEVPKELRDQILKRAVGM